MRKSLFSEEQMVKILREADGTSEPEVAKKHGVSEKTVYRLRRPLGTMTVPDTKRLKALEAENVRLKRIVAERDLEIKVMKEISAKKWWRVRSTAAGRVRDEARIVLP